VVHVDAVLQAIVTIDQLIGAGAVVLRQVRDLEALGEVKPQLLLFGKTSKDPGVKQEVVVVGFPARHRVSGGRFARGDCLLLGVADKIVHLVFVVLVTHAAAEGDGVSVIAGLQDRREVGNAVTWITAYGVGIVQLHAAARRRFAQVKELLVGIERFVVGIHTPGEGQVVYRLAVQRQLAAVKIGFLLGCANAGHRAFAQRRERVVGQALVTVVNLRNQILTPEIGVRVLQV